jgi:hypothetical protein
VKEHEEVQVIKALRGRTNSRIRGQLRVILNFVSPSNLGALAPFFSAILRYDQPPY